MNRCYFLAVQTRWTDVIFERYKHDEPMLFFSGTNTMNRCYFLAVQTWWTDVIFERYKHGVDNSLYLQIVSARRIVVPVALATRAGSVPTRQPISTRLFQRHWRPPSVTGWGWPPQKWAKVQPKGALARYRRSRRLDERLTQSESLSGRSDLRLSCTFWLMKEFVANVSRKVQAGRLSMLRETDSRRSVILAFRHDIREYVSKWFTLPPPPSFTSTCLSTCFLVMQ